MTLEELAQRLKFVSDTPMLEARLLMANATDNLDEMLERRLKHEPISKIIGRRGFWKSEFKTSKDVLDPRPDSEILVEAVLKNFPDREVPYYFLDIGTGSGCLLFSLLDEYPNATGFGLDKSEAALAIAAQNRQGRKAILVQRDFFQPDWTKDLPTFDIILSNPPYIPSDEIAHLAPEVRDYDPRIALDGGLDGLQAYQAILRELPQLLHPQGQVFFEIGKGQANDAIALAKQNNLEYKETYQDYGGIERIIRLSHPTTTRDLSGAKK